MESFFDNPVSRDELLVEAASWLDTPFRKGCAVKSAGADCVYFTAEVMRQCGVIEDYGFPPYSLDWGKHQTRSLILEWLDACPAVAKLPAAETIAAEIAALRLGDLACYKFGRVVHHLAIVLEPPRIIHALEGARVDYGELTDATWKDRFVCAYRPLPR